MSTIPDHLKHKPIIATERIDDSDAKFLSIGLAQWENDTDDISAKVFRYNDEIERWSPQSEELTLDRAIDLSILIIASTLITDAKSSPITDLKEFVHNSREFEKIKKYFQGENGKDLKIRIEELKRILDIYSKTNK